MNKLGTASSTDETPIPDIPTATLVPTLIPTATFTVVPTLTFTPLPTLTPTPCTIITSSTSVITRVGPGFNRGSFVFLPPNTPITVTGKKIVNEVIWWQLDKFQVSSGASSVNELWVVENRCHRTGGL